MMKQDLGSKRKELTISPVEPKKSKMDAKLSHIPEIKIQDAHVSMDHSNQLSHNISITNVRSVADDMVLQKSTYPFFTFIKMKKKSNLNSSISEFTRIASSRRFIHVRKVEISFSEAIDAVSKWLRLRDNRAPARTHPRE